MEKFKLLDSKNLSAADLATIRLIHRKPYLTRSDIAIFQFRVTNNDIDHDLAKLSNEALIELRNMAIGKRGIVQGCRFKPATIFRASINTNRTIKTKDGQLLKTLYAKAFMAIEDPDTEAFLREIKQSTKQDISIAYSVGKITNKKLNIPEPATCHVYSDIAEFFEWKLIIKP